jgi:hypothetical protein
MSELKTIVFTPEIVKAIQARLFHSQSTPSAESLLPARGFDPADFYRAIDDVSRAEVADLADDMARRQGGGMSTETCKGMISGCPGITRTTRSEPLACQTSWKSGLRLPTWPTCSGRAVSVRFAVNLDCPAPC